MHNVAIQFVMLFAIAFSQVIGGTSCCCLSRVLAATLTPSISRCESTSSKDQAASAGVIAKCPKCNASISKSTAKVKGKGCSIYSGSKCDCEKSNCRAITPPKVTFLTSPPDFLPTTVTTYTVAKLEPFRDQRDDIPIRSDGHSWQCTACTWLN